MRFFRATRRGAPLRNGRDCLESAASVPFTVHNFLTDYSIRRLFGEPLNDRRFQEERIQPDVDNSIQAETGGR